MRVETLQIRWHWNERINDISPVYGLDIQPQSSDGIRRLATAGADGSVRIWKVAEQESSTKVTHLAHLKRHVSAVNCVRFSPDGKYLATAGDESTIFLWEMGEAESTGDDEEDVLENWKYTKMLRGHQEDIYDLAWAPDSSLLLSGSVDNTSIIWDIVSGKSIFRLRDHKHYVQGTAWSPRGNQISTQSSDRSCKVYNITPKKNGEAKYSCVATISGEVIPSENGKSKTQRYYVDEMRAAFFRRLAYTPDGSLFITPAGRYVNDKQEECDTAFVFRSSSPNNPIFRLSGTDAPVVAIRSCPVYFKPRKGQAGPLKGLKHRMIFAVATKSSVILYDTQQFAPFALLSNLHYATISDLSWSNDGLVLAISSNDGYCSVVTFEKGELGELTEHQPKDDPCTMVKPEPSSSSSSSSSGMSSAQQNDAAKEVIPNLSLEDRGAQSPATVTDKSKRRVTPTLIQPAPTGDSKPKKAPKRATLLSTTPLGSVLSSSSVAQVTMTTSAVPDGARVDQMDTKVPTAATPQKAACQSRKPSPKTSPRRITPTLIKRSPNQSPNKRKADEPATPNQVTKALKSPNPTNAVSVTQKKEPRRIVPTKID